MHGIVGQEHFLSQQPRTHHIFEVTGVLFQPELIVVTTNQNLVPIQPSNSGQTSPIDGHIAQKDDSVPGAHSFIVESDEGFVHRLR